ncbi:MAG: hypothetical protein Q7R81_05760 [Candidatus Peregrinibacteria bacterium]|nr:hypothetical protein [Candidatus Peregrinibacteria bacterium]
MRKTVPRFNVYNRESENSEFVNYAPHNKNCYLIFGSWFNQDCLYGDTILESRNCIDCFCLEKSELSYEQVDCDRSYNCAHCQACSESSDSVFCFDCRGVRNCIGCWNLRNRENCIFNEPASKEEISTLRKQFSSWIFLQEFRTEFQRRKTERAIHKATTGANNENCTGDFLFQCKDVTFCFTVYRGQDIRYSSRVADQKDTADVEGAGNGELLYESMSTDFSYGCVGCTTCENLHNCFYCDLCFNCNDCFGCISLRRKQYCILNVQYTKEEYERTVSQLIALMRSTGEWCEFLPVTLSPFCYNETVANEHFPFTKEAVLQRKWQWKDPDPKQYMPQTFSTPDAISDVPDKISVEILGCGKCTKNYKITPQELSFYKEHRISVPRNCPDCRHMDRLNLRNPRKLWDRKCSQCERRISTSYAPDRPEIVYCEECYLMEVY